MRKIFVLLSLAFLVTVQSGNCDPIQKEASGAQRIQSQLNELTGTLPWQARLLIEINRALMHGSVSSLQAVNLRQAIDGVGKEEDRYLTGGKPTPSAVIRQQSSDLSGIQEKLKSDEKSAPFQVFTGSAFLQDQVRAAVDRSLGQGTIVANQATDLRKNVDLISAEEAWYLTSGSGTIPEKVIEKDVTELHDLDGQLKRSLVGGKIDTAL